MIPSLIAGELDAGMPAYIRREFPVATPFFCDEHGRSIIERFLEDDAGRSAMVKGPWADVALPFRQAPADAALPFAATALADVAAGRTFKTYLHQYQAFTRLDWRHAQSTIIATGTGSGKTECFLYPILDYCLNNAHLKGIKALIIYPMNALAADQEKRLAEILSRIRAHYGKQLTAGLYTGDDDEKFTYMGDTHLIRERGALRSNPPDILLTNYKMLDFLLLRQEDQPLWEGNGPGVMKYLVVDELHTFDGAQGTDLSCLVRRLKERLGFTSATGAADSLACVGTSATMGGRDSIAELCAYASAVFATDITPESGAVITEDRLTVSEYLGKFPYRPQGRWPDPVRFKNVEKSTVSAYLRSVTTGAWFPDDDFGFKQDDGILDPKACVRLGEALPNLAGFRRLLEDLQTTHDLGRIAEDWYDKDLGEVRTRFSPRGDGQRNPEGVALAREMILSLLAMISAARVSKGGADADDGDGEQIARADQNKSQKESYEPFLHVRCQLWFRSLVNVLSTVSREPKMLLAADRHTPGQGLTLPLISCNSCCQLMWGAVVKGDLMAADARVSTDLRGFYERWFRRDPEVRLLLPVCDVKEWDERRDTPGGNFFVLCPGCGRLTQLARREDLIECLDGSRTCGECHRKDLVAVWIPDTQVQKGSGDNRRAERDEICPHCQVANALRIVGSRSTTLAAAATDIVNASKFNDDHKLIAFSDSVQDAALHAGFIQARVYTGIVRRAVSFFLEQKNLGPRRPLRLTAALQGFADFWLMYFESQNRGQRERGAESAAAGLLAPDALAKLDFLATFTPPDMQWLYRWREFKEAALIGEQKLLALETGDKKPQFDEFLDMVRQRLTWEMLTELTHKSEKVHSLQHSAVATVFADPAELGSICGKIGLYLKEHCAITASEPQLVCFVLGLLRAMKDNGAVDPAGFGQMQYKLRLIEDRFGGFLKTGNVWNTFFYSLALPDYSTRRLPPRGLGLRPAGRDDLAVAAILGSGRKPSWFERWLRKCLESKDAKIPEAYTADIYVCAVQALMDAGLITQIRRANGSALWLLNPESLFITNDVKLMVCTKCGRRFNMSGQEADRAEGMPCLSYECDGMLKVRELPGTLAEPVDDTNIWRINAAEHTALIDGRTRALVERSFSGKEGASDDDGKRAHKKWQKTDLSSDHKDREQDGQKDAHENEQSKVRPARTWDINLLAASPTLEMGIDIGALSAVMLCNVPPEKSNYLQRSGRAGRKDGNALTMTMVGRSQHDLYFWDNPEDMICGEAKVPGVFLRAVSVLERQLFAYALGRYVRENLSVAGLLPERLSRVLEQYKKRPDLFPGSFITWVNQYADSLVSGFTAMFSTDAQAHQALDAEKRDYLYRYAAGGGSGDTRSPTLAERLTDMFESASILQEDWLRQNRELDKRIREIGEPKDEARSRELEDLRAEKEAVVQYLKTEYREKRLFEWFTDQGLLPNYAFPEDGVTVDSVVIKRSTPKIPKSAAGTAPAPKLRPEVRQFSFRRGAAQALRALSPGSVFYVNGFKMHVDCLRLRRSSGAGGSAIERWRLCPECSYLEKVDPARPVPDCCPVCGCDGFSDTGQVKSMLRVRELVAHADVRRDQINDDSDVREPNLQNCMLFVNALPDRVLNAWRIEDDRLAFGFEFLKEVSIREVNFGSEMAFGNELQVAGVTLTAPGFSVCRDCGAVLRKARGGEHQHMLGCRHYDHELDQESGVSAQNAFDSGLFLMREITSEAIRIRLPVTTEFDPAGARRDTYSLMAALYLGLQRHFRGSVRHLRICEQTEPDRNEGSGRMVNLVIYDSIPGGSGYLKDLMRPAEHEQKYANMLTLLRETLEALQGCECADDPEKDGCYHCVYRYGDNRLRDYVSRSRAEELVRGILQAAEKRPLKTIRTLGEIGSGAGGELERLFLRRLSELPGCEMRLDPTVECTNSWLLTVPLQNEAVSALNEAFAGYKFNDHFLWRIDCQRDYSGSITSRPDFMIYPEIRSLVEKRPDFMMHVFTDGWEFHAGKLSDDSAKRQAILNDGHRVWSLTWQDVAGGGSPLADAAGAGVTAGFFNHDKLGKVAATFAPLCGKAFDQQETLNLLENLGSFDLFLMWLMNPAGLASKLRDCVTAAALSADPAGENELESCDGGFPEVQRNRPDRGDLRWFRRRLGERGMIALGYGVSTSAPFDVEASLLLDDHRFAVSGAIKDQRLQGQWRAALRLASILQFCRQLWWCTQSNQGDAAVYDVNAASKRPEDASRMAQIEAVNDGWRMVFEDMCDDAELFANIHKLCTEVMRKQLNAPDEIGLDGCAGSAVISVPAGLKWQMSDADVYLFAKKDLFDHDPENFAAAAARAEQGQRREILISDLQENWLEKLTTALAGETHA